MPALSGHALSGGRENSRVPFPGNRFSVLSDRQSQSKDPTSKPGVMSPWKPETGSHAAGDPPSAGAVARYLAGHSIVTPIIQPEGVINFPVLSLLITQFFLFKNFLQMFHGQIVLGHHILKGFANLRRKKSRRDCDLKNNIAITQRFERIPEAVYAFDFIGLLDFVDTFQVSIG